MLVLLRHGESCWNAEDRFAGWIDVALTPAGRAEARAAGRQLSERGLAPDVVHTSRLDRAISTGDLVLDACGRPEVPLMRTELLNERHYGALQGQRRSDAVVRYGAERVTHWRRGIHGRPPLDEHGRGESLADVRHRLRPYVRHCLTPLLVEGRTVLVVSHGNTIRMLRQLVEGLSDEEAAGLAVPTGSPTVLDLLSVRRRAG